MNFNKHFNLKDKHAFLGASKYSWLNYDADKLKESFYNNQARYRGTQLHEFASMAINLGQKMPANHKTLNMFVNDAIGYRMESEQILYYSDNCFGTADAIGYKEKNKKLRIHDLKTGTIKASMNQLKIYAALFCLDYDVDPNSLKNMTLQIYQNDEVLSEEPDASEISEICDKIIEFDEVLENLKEDLNNV